MTEPTGFSVRRRNHGHWDISNASGRLFRLRGGPGDWSVFDERADRARRPNQTFRDQATAMSYICTELMFELLTAEGQSPTVIEDWNVSVCHRPNF